MKQFVTLLFTCLLFAPWLHGAEASGPHWPQFRGPNASGVAPKAKPPVKIGPEENLQWKVEVPWGASSPVVWGDQIYLTAFADGELQTRCYSRKNGRELWVKGIRPEKLEMYHSTESSPAASTPATDGRYVVSYFGSVGLVCYDTEGKEVWRYAMPVARSGGGFGTGTSPIIAGSKVILNRDQDRNSSLIAISLKDGKKLWETPRPQAMGSFGTPIIWRNDGTQEIVTPGSIRLNGYDLKTGAERWVFEGVTPFACTTPVVGDGHLFFAGWSPGKADSPFPAWAMFSERFDKNKNEAIEMEELPSADREYLRGLDVDASGTLTKSDLEKIQARNAKGENVLVAIKPGGTGNISKSHGAWRFTRGLPYVPSPLYYDGRVYIIRDGMVTSLDAKTGQANYTQERIGANGSYYASPVAADGRIYFVSLPGKLTVIGSGGDKPEVLHQVDFGESVFATPAIVANSIYLRTKSKLYAWTKSN